MMTVDSGSERQSPWGIRWRAGAGKEDLNKPGQSPSSRLGHCRQKRPRYWRGGACGRHESILMERLGVLAQMQGLLCLPTQSCARIRQAVQFLQKINDPFVYLGHIAMDGTARVCSTKATILAGQVAPSRPRNLLRWLTPIIRLINYPLSRGHTQSRLTDG